jgi:hypothetical protein
MAMSDITIHDFGTYRRRTRYASRLPGAPATRAVVFFSSCAIAWGGAIILALSIREAIGALW